MRLCHATFRLIRMFALMPLHCFRDFLDRQTFVILRMQYIADDRSGFLRIRHNSSIWERVPGQRIAAEALGRLWNRNNHSGCRRLDASCPVVLRPANRESARLAIADTRDAALTAISIFRLTQWARRTAGQRSPENIANQQMKMRAPMRTVAQT